MSLSSALSGHPSKSPWHTQLMGVHSCPITSSFAKAASTISLTCLRARSTWRVIATE